MNRKQELVIREVATGQDKVWFSHRADRTYLKDVVIETAYKLDHDDTLYTKAISDAGRRAPIKAIFKIYEPIRCDTVDEEEIIMVREVHLLENYMYYTPMDSVHFKYERGPDWYPDREATRVLPGSQGCDDPEYYGSYPEVCSCGAHMKYSREDGIVCPNCDTYGA